MEKNKDKGSVFYTVIIIILSVLIVFRVISYFTIVEVDVSGSSMVSTVESGDKVLVSRLSKAQRGDIIVLDVEKYEDKHMFGAETKMLIKRLIATEGDEVYCEDSTLYIRYANTEEFVPLHEEYVSSTTPNFPLVTVGEGEIFFLGDNRAVSNDSTEVGCLLASDIFGVVWLYSIEHPWVTYLF